METPVLQQPPENPDSTANYLFYLHGLIIEIAGIRPKSEEHGYYEYQKILEELAGHGFTVISEAREKGTEVRVYAEKIVSQVQHLLKKGVPPQNITVVGASKGGIITAYVSLLLGEKELNYVFLAGLFEKCLVDKELRLYGRVLSIHDRSDKLSITPEPYFTRSQGSGRFEQLVVSLNLGHGLIYQPYPEWVGPAVDWAKGREK